MAVSGTDDRYIHYPKGNQYPPPWRSPEPEPLRRVEMSCGCFRRFRAPVPPRGAALFCNIHGPVRVEVVAVPVHTP